MGIVNIIMILFGAGCALWCIGLVLWVAYLDRTQRQATIHTMNRALEAILARTAELRRKHAANPAPHH